MSGSSNLVPSWMLRLLLLSLFIALSNSRYTTRTAGKTTMTDRSCRLNEFQTDLDKLVNFVEKHNCSEDCSSVPITAEACRCLNLSVSEDGRVFTAYFTKGLKLLRGVNNQTVTNINKTLNRSLTRFNERLGKMKMDSEPFIPPGSFVKELRVQSQRISSICAETASNQ